MPARRAGFTPVTGKNGGRRRAGCAAACALLLSACSGFGAPRHTSPDIDIPAAWSAAPATLPNTPKAAPGDAALSQWWLRFNDPLLTSLISRALEANTSVQAATAALRQARAARDLSAAGLWPSLDGAVSAQRNRNGNADATSTYRAGLDAAWEIDVFGGNRAALAAGEAGVRAGTANLADVQVSVAAEVALNYVALRGAEARLAIGESNLASQMQTRQFTTWRMQAGLASSLDTEQARAAAEQTAAQQPLLRAAVAQAQHALAVLTGQPPAALANELAAGGPIPQAGDDIAPAMPAEVLRRRPDVRMAEHQLAAALARVDVADVARLPNFRLSGSLGLGAASFSALGDSASVLRAMLAAVSMPLFDGGAGAAQVRVQEAALEQTRVAYAASILTALKEVEDALALLHNDRERRARLAQAADAAANAALMAGQRYASGLIDFQTVLDTQRTQLNTQDSLASAEATVAGDVVRLCKALGGGWTPEAAVEAPAPASAINRDDRTSPSSPTHAKTRP